MCAASPRSAKPASAGASPLARFDAAVRRRTGAALLGGVDEAGRGALAGPVLAACVVLAPGTSLPEVNDSKVLSAEKREALVPLILSRAAAWGVGWASAAEVDQINILQATLRAAGRAIKTLATQPEYLLTDFLKLPAPPCPIEPLVDGDARSLAIAAASVLAKVARDRIMTVLHEEYPLYGFAGHKGYGTAAHWAALDAHGPSTIHRLSYRGVCFFDAAPSVRAKSRARLAALPAPPATPDWLTVLTTPASELDPCLFLPACEREEEI
jgi:ribonuclease HII